MTTMTGPRCTVHSLCVCVCVLFVWHGMALRCRHSGGVAAAQAAHKRSRQLSKAASTYIPVNWEAVDDHSGSEEQGQEEQQQQQEEEGDHPQPPRPPQRERGREGQGSHGRLGQRHPRPPPPRSGGRSGGRSGYSERQRRRVAPMRFAMDHYHERASSSSSRMTSALAR
jgi:hypothetical protein